MLLLSSSLLLQLLLILCVCIKLNFSHRLTNFKHKSMVKIQANNNKTVSRKTSCIFLWAFMGLLAEDIFIYVNYSHVNASACMAKTRLKILTAWQCQQRQQTQETSDICTYLTMSSHKQEHRFICMYVFRKKINKKYCWCPKSRSYQLVAPNYIIMCGD